MKSEIYINHYGFPNSLTIEFPDKCPYCEKDFAYKSSEWNFICGNKIYLVTHCIHCNEQVLSIYNLHKNETIHTFPSNSFSDLQPELKKLSPNACKIFEQALYAKSLKLNNLVGPGLRMSLEWLVWDYLTEFKKIPEEDVKKLTLHYRIENYFKSDQEKYISAKIIKYFGNDEIHLFKDYDINVEEAIIILQALFQNIYLEIMKQNINSNLPE